MIHTWWLCSFPEMQFAGGFCCLPIFRRLQNHTLQHTAAHCNTLQHTATHCTTLHHTATHCNTLQHTATHCTTLHHTAPHCNTLQHTATMRHSLLQEALTESTLKMANAVELHKITTTPCNTLQQHTATTHCNNTLQQHAAPLRPSLLEDALKQSTLKRANAVAPHNISRNFSDFLYRKVLACENTIFVC